MENASKALLIAAEILIALMVISIGVYLWANFSKVSETYSQEMSSQQIQEFNTNFTKYQGRTNITAQEIVSVIHFAKETKNKTGITVQVRVGSSYMEGKAETELTDFLIYRLGNIVIDPSNSKIIIPYYECIGVTINTTTGLVSEIDFKLTT